MFSCCFFTVFLVKAVGLLLMVDILLTTSDVYFSTSLSASADGGHTFMYFIYVYIYKYIFFDKGTGHSAIH